MVAPSTRAILCPYGTDPTFEAEKIVPTKPTYAPLKKHKNNKIEIFFQYCAVTPAAGNAVITLKSE